MSKQMGAHLVERSGVLYCSICGVSFQATANKSLSRSFSDHVRSEHRNEPTPLKDTANKKNTLLQTSNSKLLVVPAVLPKEN